jgi:hypothetical protein
VGPLPRARSSTFALRIAVTLCICACLAIFAEEAAGQMKDTEQQPNSKQSQISGHVYRSDTGEPISKAQVSLDPQDDKTQETAGGSRIVRTGPDGPFVFSGVPPGSYTMNAWRNGFARRSSMAVECNPGFSNSRPKTRQHDSAPGSSRSHYRDRVR